MGLGLIVGILADLQNGDPEGYVDQQKQFLLINQTLQAARLPRHHEPLEISDLGPWVWDFPLAELAALRYLAIHLATEHHLPEPASITPGDRQFIHTYISQLPEQATQPGFNHLLRNCDVYLPMHFPVVLKPLTDAMGQIGSSVVLLDECRQIAAALHLPMDLDQDGTPVMVALDKPEQATLLWQRYGAAARMCLRLVHACQMSLQSGCAIVIE